MSRQPPSPIKLPIHEPAPAAACPSSRYLWDEEIEVVRAMHEIKLEVRSARECEVRSLPSSRAALPGPDAKPEIYVLPAAEDDE